jgi:4-hydroxymandelate oxidase
VDVLKMLALGVHAVLVGRPLILEQMRNELKVAMIYTGCASVCEIGEEVPWR